LHVTISTNVEKKIIYLLATIHVRQENPYAIKNKKLYAILRLKQTGSLLATLKSSGRYLMIR